MRFSDSIVLLLSLSSSALGFEELTSLSSSALGFEEGAHHDSLRPLSHTAYHRVEQLCAADVERLCKDEEEERELTTTFSSPMASSPVSSGEENTTSKDPASVPTPTSPPSSDPFLDMVFSSSPLSEELSDFSRFMDQLFESVIATSYVTSSSSSSMSSSRGSSNSDESGASANGDGSSTSTSSTSTFFYSSPSSSFVIYEETPTLFIDYGVARLAAEREPEEIPLLASQLRSYGSGILLSSMMGGGGGGGGGVYATTTTADCPYRTQMARRLTEMDAKTIQYHVRLPFGTTKNVCLKDAFGTNEVSSECADSISRLEKTFVIEEMGYESFGRMLWIYGATLAFLNVLLVSHCFQKQDENEDEDDYEYYDYETDDQDEHGEARYALLEDDRKVLIVPVKKIVYEGVPLQIV